MLIILKFPKRTAGLRRTKCPRGPHADRVFETPGLHGCEITCALKQHLLNVKFSYREHCW